jgi:hypothetical protein
MHDKTGIRWVRVIIAGVLTEAGVVLLIVTIVTAYRYVLSPTDAEYQMFADQVGSYVGVFGGAVAAFVFALWVSRSLRADFLINGLLVGGVAALLHIGLLAGAGAEFQMAYVIGDVLKLVGGALGGICRANANQWIRSSLNRKSVD